MPEYLLAAEADQIQDLIFRASRLREAVGGSQLLSRFCLAGAPMLLKKYNGGSADIIVSDGGAFRIKFTDDNGEVVRQRAISFGRDLAQLYHRCTGGNLTVAEPVLYENNFQETNAHAQKKLREAKNQGGAPVVAAHLPYLAFCASCGLEIAAQWHQQAQDERSNYYCIYCLRKENERKREHDKLKHGDLGGFLGLFYQKVIEYAGPAATERVFLQDSDEVGRYDARNYVAYLLADGNGMGDWFSRCDDEQMRILSHEMPQVLRQSLAAPCNKLFERIDEYDNKANKTDPPLIPVLPLILGGDDLFALLPARWSLDFAAQFCRNFEENMLAIINKVKLPCEEALSQPTVSAAVVICKSSYPYSLAHKHGEMLLKQAKAFARQLKLEKKIAASAINFSIISGNQHSDEPLSDDGEYCSTLRPYFAHTPKTDKNGSAIEQLLAARLELKDLAGKRRAELEALYDISVLPKNSQECADWKEKIFGLMKRINPLATTENSLLTAMQSLGDKDQPGYWRKIKRPQMQAIFGHGLPDLLQAWDYCFKLDEPVINYERE